MPNNINIKTPGFAEIDIVAAPSLVSPSLQFVEKPASSYASLLLVNDLAWQSPMNKGTIME